MHSLYPLTRSGWFWTSQRASASRTRGRLAWRAALMIQATVACISGSRPRPGPITRQWRLGMRAAMVWAMSEASEGLGWADSRRRGCTIRLGEYVFTTAAAGVVHMTWDCGEWGRWDV